MVLPLWALTPALEAKVLLALFALDQVNAVYVPGVQLLAVGALDDEFVCDLKDPLFRVVVELGLQLLRGQVGDFCSELLQLKWYVSCFTKKIARSTNSIEVVVALDLSEAFPAEVDMANRTDHLVAPIRL